VLGLFFSYGIVLQAIAILHFIRRRPDTYWIFIIIMGGGLGALVYIAVEVVPDLRLLGGAFQVFPRRKRIKYLEGIVIDNPSVGNIEELGDLYLDDKQYAKARACFDRIVGRTDELDPVYRRALSAIGLDDYAAAAKDLEQVLARDPKYAYQRAAGLYAHVLAKLGQHEQADATFQSVLEASTLTETEYNYATFLAARGRKGEARAMTEKILRKKKTMPDYIRRRERPWFWKATALQKRL
jgi:hypothetical protein